MVTFQLLTEFELNRMKERQKEGIEKAKDRGAYKSNGRPKGTTESMDEYLNKPKTKKIIKELKKGRSLRETSLVCKCSLSTVQKVQSYLRFLEDGNEVQSEEIVNYIPYIKE